MTRNQCCEVSLSLVVPYEEVLPKRDYSTSAGIGHYSFKSSKIGFNRLFAFNLNNSCDNRRNSFVPFIKIKGNRKISISNKKAIRVQAKEKDCHLRHTIDRVRKGLGEGALIKSSLSTLSFLGPS